MCSKNHTQQYLLIMNGYNSYIIINFITFCIKYLINLFILFLHILHLFQLFDVNMFMLLKHTLIEKVDAIF